MPPTHSSRRGFKLVKTTFVISLLFGAFCVLTAIPFGGVGKSKASRISSPPSLIRKPVRVRLKRQASAPQSLNSAEFVQTELESDDSMLADSEDSYEAEVEHDGPQVIRDRVQDYLR